MTNTENQKVEHTGVKDFLMLDGNARIEIHVDFDNMTILREVDRRIARINSKEGNVLYMNGKDSNRRSVIIFDEKFAICGTINESNLYYSQPMGVWHMPKSKGLYFEVAKNACTSIVSEIYLSNWKTWYMPRITKKRSVWDALFWNNSWFKHKYNISQYEYFQNTEKFKGYTKFLVYDDPIKRFLRMINNKYINHHLIASTVQPPYDKNLSDYIDKVILVAQLDAMHSDNWDQHLVPISVSGEKYLDEITDFCYLKDLDAFMKSKFGLSCKRENVMPQEKKAVTMETLLPRQIERLKEIYKKDYEIPIKYADKFFKPE